MRKKNPITCTWYNTYCIVVFIVYIVYVGPSHFEKKDSVPLNIFYWTSHICTKFGSRFQGSRNYIWVWWSYWKKCQSSLIFYCKIPILCQSLSESAQILLVMSDRTDTFRELCVFILISSDKLQYSSGTVFSSWLLIALQFCLVY